MTNPDPQTEMEQLRADNERFRRDAEKAQTFIGQLGLELGTSDIAKTVRELVAFKARINREERAEIAEYVDSVLNDEAYASSGADVADWLFRHYTIIRKA